MLNRQLAGSAAIALLAISVNAHVVQSQEVDSRYRLSESVGSIVTYHKDGPVGIHLLTNNRLVACEYAPGALPAQGVALAKAIVVIDLESGREISRMPFAEQFVSKNSGCSFDGRYFFACYLKSGKLFDLETGTLVRSWSLKHHHAFPVFSPHGSTLALCEERDISLWDMSSGESIGQLPPHPTIVRSAAFSEDGSFLLSSCAELTRRWDLPSQASNPIPISHPLQFMSINPAESRLYGMFSVSSEDFGVGSFDLRSGRRLMDLQNHSAIETDFAGDRLFSVDIASNAVQVRQLSNPDSVKYLPYDQRVRQITNRDRAPFVDELKLSPDKKFLMVRLEYGRLSQIWRLNRHFDQMLLASVTGLAHKYVPVQPEETKKKKSREELFLEEIRGIVYKVEALKDQGDVGQAEQEIVSLLAAGERRLQRAPRRHQLLIEQCAYAYRDFLQQPEKSLALFLKALEMSESSGRFDASWENSVSRVSLLQSSLGNRVAAAETFRRLVDRRHADGKPVKASDYAQLAVWIFDADDPKAMSESVQLLLKAWTLSKNEAGTLNRETRGIYDKLVVGVALAGNWELLEPVLVEQLAEYEHYMGQIHPDTAQAALQLAQLYERIGKPTEALATMDRSQRVLREHAARILPMMAEKEQTKFLEQHFQPSLSAAFAMAIRLEKHPGTAGISAGWILNAKGTATRALAERARMTASTADPAVRTIATELAQTRERMSSLSLAAQQVPEGAYDGARKQSPKYTELEQLRDRESELSWKLGQAGWTELRQDPWVPLDDVRQKIPSDSVLIEFAVTGLPGKRRDQGQDNVGRVSKIGINPGAPKVIAWIIPPAGKGEVRMSVVCQDWNALAQSVSRFHACLGGQMIPRDFNTLIPQYLAEMAKCLSDPLPTDVLATKKWLISPDHLLWLVPWAALPDKQKRFLVYSHEVQYLQSGRDLLTHVTLKSQSVPLIVAAPDYSKNSEESSDAVPFAPLPGTAEEARGILPYLREIAGAEPELYIGDQAEESVVKAAKRPKIAVFSTHGFSDIRRDQHPLATCGLAFCNANAAIKGNGDGILTGLEVLATDYRGTELVVLSACQTGLGIASSGEGVAGLRYAFQLAGARNVAATLWSIPDKITAEMMTTFFKHYASGQSPSAALRLAQLSIIEKLEANGYRAAPQLWAAFTIAGPPPEEAL